MTDEELLAATVAARKAAHDAPFCEYSLDKQGHTRLLNHTYAWSERSREWIRLADEVDRRGLKQPSLN
jgi:hypothetical protein